MTKLEQTIANLKADQPPQPPRQTPDIRRRLALALMRADRQINCKNCKWRYRPCTAHEKCKEGNFSHFSPKDTLVRMQLCRVDELMREINQMTE